MDRRVRASGAHSSRGSAAVLSPVLLSEEYAAGRVWRFCGGRDEGETGKTIRGLEGGAAGSASLPGGDGEGGAGDLSGGKTGRHADVLHDRVTGGTLRDPDYPALEVAVNILGSGFTSRLMSQIRTKMGLAYSIGAGWGAAYDHPGTFRIVGSTKSASTTDAILAARTELEKMRAAEVTEQELKTAKDSVLNSFVFFFDSPAKTLNRMMMYEYFGYPKDFLFEYQKKVTAVTRADVLRVMQEHIHPENLSIVAVGNPKDFGKPLSAAGKVQQIDLAIPPMPAK